MTAREEFVCKCGCIHRVAVYREGCKYRVEPGRIVVHPGAKVTFIPMPGTEHKGAGIRVWLPDGPAPETRPPVPPGGPLPVQVGQTIGVFPYSVYVSGDIGPDFAEGGSSPRIIVADP